MLFSRTCIPAKSTFTPAKSRSSAERRNHLVQLPPVLVLRGADRPQQVQDQISPLIAHARPVLPDAQLTERFTLTKFWGE